MSAPTTVEHADDVPRERGPRRQARLAGRGTGWRARVPGVAAAALTVLALVCAVAAVSEVFSYHFQPVRAVINEVLVAAPANLGYAALVTVLAIAVANRKRLAWQVLVTYFVIQILVDVGVFTVLSVFPPARSLHRGHPWLHWLTPAGVGVSLAVLVVLWLARGEFYARAQRASLAKAAAAFLGLMAAFILIGWGLVSLFPGSLHRGVDTLSYAAERVLFGGVRFDFTRVGRAPGLVNLWLGVLGAVAVVVALLVLFRSQRVNAALTPDEEVRLRQLLAVHGERDSLGYFATRRDKEVVFSGTGKAAVTYRVVGPVSLASGDPIGDPEAWGPAIKAWLEQAREYAWTPAVMGASEEGALAYARAAGLHAFAIGDEAIVHVDRFSLDGRDMRQVRQAVNRVKRAGYTVRVRRHADIPATAMARTIELAAEWRDTETERGFSMALGRLGDPADGQCVLVEARDRDGNEAALLSFTPWGSTGLSLDLMRRDRSRENGLVEFMVSELVAAAPKLGVKRISMNFAAFRAVFEDGARVGAGPVLRAWRGTLLFLSRWMQMESLYRSNVKYRPERVPRFLCFEDNHDLATVAITSVIAEGLLPVPNVRTLLRRGLAAPLVLPDEALPPLSAAPDRTPAVSGTDEQTRVRLAKLDRLRDSGTDPYPASVPRTVELAAVRAGHPELPPDTHTGARVSVAGRVVLLRDHGAHRFATLRDWSGDLQVMLTAESLGAAALRAWHAGVDLGDTVSVSGEVITTRSGELTVLAGAWVLAAKCLHPLPDKHRGLVDPESRVRQRHLDLVVSPAARDMLRIRGAVLGALRATLGAQGFLEVETPLLQPVHGGAAARPFATHHNAYDIPMYLRIAPELYLKRLAVGGVGRVYELGRAFRNEGVDTTHNPEFTILEAYQAYSDYTGMRALARELIVAAATAAYGAPVLRRTAADGVVTEVDLAAEWPVVTVHDAVSRALGSPVDAGTDAVTLCRFAAAAGVPVRPGWDAGQIVLELYERLVEPATVRPTFYLDFPLSVSPLTRQHRVDPRLAERWDLVGFGMELGTAYTELTDPVEQRCRLTAQSLRAAGGDPEAMELDADFLHALEYGMPPTGGLGMGVDRLVMLLTGRSIRETLPFPTVRPNTPVSR